METIIDLLQKYNIPYREAGQHHHVSQGWVGIDCPWCSPGSEHFRLGWNLTGGYLSCWACGYVHPTRTLMTLAGITHSQATEYLVNVLCEKQYQDDKPRGILKLPQNCSPLGTPQRCYLRGRGFNPDELESQWALLGTSNGSNYPWRIVIPIIRHAQIVSWTARACSDDNPKRYITARHDEESFPAKHWLYGLDHVRHAVIVCEGPTDVWRVGPGAVCTFGLSYSREQVLLLSKIPKRVIVFDSEPAAQRKAKRLVNDLVPFPGHTHLIELDSKDPGSARPDEICKLRSYLDE
jgi:hypothetical protein